MKYSEDLLKFLPLGYLYLIILGIFKESFFYYQLGINILKYSTIMDILISPIAEIFSHPIMLGSIFLLFAIYFYLPALIEKNKDKKKYQKMFELESTEGLSPDETRRYYETKALKLVAVFLLSFFVGTGVGGGYFTSRDIKNNKLKFDYKLNFNSGESEQVTLLETNSLYYFYVAKGTKTIKIAPIGTIKNLELIHNKMIQ